MEEPKAIMKNEPQKSEESALLPQQEKKKITCMSVTCWIFQILIWAGAISLLYINFYEKSELSFSDDEYITTEFILIVTFEGMFYICYVIFQFCSPTFYYLLHKKNDVKLVDKMKQLFNTPPKIKFVVECYHYETRTYTTTDSKGNTTTRTQTVRVVTRVDSKFFDYYSSRDVSGLFRLNYDESAIANKFYVKLELLANIEFADAVTYDDYIREKDEIYQRNVGFDTYTDIFVYNIVEGLTSYNLINITDNNPCGMSIFWYIIFIFMGIVQLYKIYINSRCVYKSFTVRKLISSRYSLTTEESDIKYRKFNPSISFEEENYNFTTNEIGYISNDVVQNLPTQEEIERAQQYNDKVFNVYNYTQNDVVGCKEEIPQIALRNVQNEDINTNNYNDNNLEAKLIYK
jgi:hypothetical protein